MYSLIYSYSVTQVMSKRVEKLNSSIVALSRPVPVAWNFLLLLHLLFLSSYSIDTVIHNDWERERERKTLTPFTSLHLHCTRLLIFLLLLLKHESNLPSLLWQTGWYKRNYSLSLSPCFCLHVRLFLSPITWLTRVSFLCSLPQHLSVSEKLIK